MKRAHVQGPTKCAFCDGSLGTNRVLLSSSIGAHVAYSEALGRVWFVCVQCDRWNLSDPAFAGDILRECLSRFAAAPDRVVSNGIGQVVRGSFVATSIDDQTQVDLLVHRHAQRSKRAMQKRTFVLAALAPASLVGYVAGHVLLDGAAGTIAGIALTLVGVLAVNRLQRRRRVTWELSNGQQLSCTRAEVAHAALETEGASWALRIPTGGHERILRGADALLTLARLIPIFRRPATPEIVTRAVERIRSMPDGFSVIRAVAARSEAREDGRRNLLFTNPRSIWATSDEELVALEIVATENRERALLEVELAVVTDGMNEALAIAHIIDRELS